MERGTWILVSMAYYIISFIVWFAVEGGNGCLVVPSAAAVIAGDNISLTCTSETDAIVGWDRGSDYNSRSNVYKAPVYSKNGSISYPSIIVDGYSVDDSVDHQLILIMNKASTVQADRYYCSCYPSSFTASVTVLVSKPTFAITSQIVDGGPINVMCSISFNGTADSSVTITDVSGIKMAEKRVTGTYPSTSNNLRVISLDYNTTADSNIDQTYSCQVILSNNSSPIYSELIETSVQWIPTRNVQVMPVDNTRCSNGSKCAINQALNCIAEGNPYPVRFQWTGFLNGSQFSDDTSRLLNLTSVGNYTVQCTAFNRIGYITYNSTSQYFKTEVTVEGPPTPLPDTQQANSHVSVIVGVVVGVGGSLIVIVVIVVVVIKRKKSRTVCCNQDDKDTRNNVELPKTYTNSTSPDSGLKKNGQITSGVLNKGSDEVTVVDNHLYSGAQKAKQIDPSDGGYASINEVMPHGK